MSVHDIAQTQTLIALESAVSADMQNIFTNLIPRMGDGLRNLYQDLVGMPLDKRMLSDQDRFLSLIAGYDYMDITSITVPVPEGLATDYLTYSNAVLVASLHAKSLDEQVLTPLQRYLSQLVNDRTARFSTAPAQKKPLAERAKRTVQIHQALIECFDKKRRDHLTYEQAVRRNADWTEVFKTAQALVKNGQIDGKAIQQKVNTILELVDAVVRMAKDGELGNVTRQVTNEVADMIHLTAQEVSFIGAVFYHQKSLMTVMPAGIKKLIKNLA